MKALRFNSVLILIIIANILNMLYPKGMGYEVQTGIEYQLSKYAYGLCILIMLPSLLSTKKFYFNKMRYMAFMIIIYILFGYGFHMSFEMGDYLKTLMICLSFLFFEDIFEKRAYNKQLIYVYVLSIFVNITYLTLTQSQFATAVENEGHIGGGQGIATSMVFLVPFMFYLFKGKLSAFLYLLGMMAIIVSLRRTAILAYLFCLPFVYSRIKSSMSKTTLFFIVLGLALIGYVVVTDYWFVMEDRFADTFEEDKSGYYGSGRTGWWQVLVDNFIDSPGNWLQGFGVGRVAQDMANAGFPFESAHNDYLEIGYTYGFIGLFLWFGTIIDILRLSWKTTFKGNRPLISMCSLSYLLVAFVSGVTRNPHFMCVAMFGAMMLSTIGRGRLLKTIRK